MDGCTMNTCISVVPTDGLASVSASALCDLTRRSTYFNDYEFAYYKLTSRGTCLTIQKD